MGHAITFKEAIVVALMVCRLIQYKGSALLVRGKIFFWVCHTFLVI